MKCNTQNLTDKQNYNCIDLAKFVCAILVVMIHVAPFGNPDETCLISYLNYGIQHYLARSAVPFFFVCSGFFLYRKATLESFSLEPTKKYALRLLKLYIIWTLIYFPLSFLDFFTDEKGVVYAVLVYIRNCVFLGSYRQLWYFPATIFAVLLVSFLLYKRVSPKKLIIMAFLLYLTGLLAQSWFGIITPLREITPTIWSILKLIKVVIGTTRDGLFEGFLFVSIGMLFAFYDFSISKKKALVGFMISMLLLFAEAFLLKYFDFVRGHDMYLFLVPVSFFSFAFIRQVELPNNPIYKTLRMLSSLIFYSHLWVEVVVKKVLMIVDETLSKTCLVFIITIIITIVGSIMVIELSKLRKFSWLKKLYL